MKKVRKLTLKQEKFVAAYVGPARGNATEAARMAGYKGNDVTLGTVGGENMKKPAIVERIEAARAELRAKAILTREEILAGLASIARGEGEEPHVLQSGETVFAPPRFADRRAAIMDAAKLQGLLVDKVEIKALDGLQAQLRELQERMSDEAFEELLAALSEE